MQERHTESARHRKCLHSFAIRRNGAGYEGSMNRPRASRRAIQSLGGAALAVLVANCGGRVAGDPGQGAAEGVSSAPARLDASDAMGSIVAQVELPFGTVISTFTYELSGAGSDLRPSTPTVVDGPSVAFRIGDVPAARGYTLALKASPLEGGECTSSASFNVAAKQPTVVILIATCSGDAAPN